MENDQVTFAVTASGLKGKHGRPILILCEALEGLPQQLIWYRAGPHHTSEVNRMELDNGPLSAHRLQVIQDVTQRELYTSLLFWKGVQAEFEVPPV